MILVLVLMVVGALIVLPLMELRHVGRADQHRTQREDRARTEAVKAGLADGPGRATRLYETCGAGGGTVGIPLTASGLAVPVTTQCYSIDSALSLEPPRSGWASAAVQKGQAVATRNAQRRVRLTLDPTSTSAWIAETSLKSEINKIWMPNLPVHGLSPRSPLGWQMPAGFRRVHGVLPRHVHHPVTIDGPTYFASGIYYFEDTVLINAARRLAERGRRRRRRRGLRHRPVRRLLCGQRAVDTQHQRPRGDVRVRRGRPLWWSNNVGGPINVEFNKRYVAASDPGAAPSADVSIMSVNGKLGVDGITGENLLIPDVLEVPLVARRSGDPAGAPGVGHDAEVPTVDPRPTTGADCSGSADESGRDRIPELDADLLDEAGEHRRLRDHWVHRPGGVRHSAGHAHVFDLESDVVPDHRFDGAYELHVHRGGDQRRRHFGALRTHRRQD